MQSGARLVGRQARELRGVVEGETDLAGSAAGSRQEAGSYRDQSFGCEREREGKGGEGERDASHLPAA